MKSNNPPFEITSQMIDDVAEIAELVGQIKATNHFSSNPTLRRSNRIRTVYGSLAIEQNTLSLEQVTAVLDGKVVFAPPKDIAEVKNAYDIYNQLDKLNPYDIEDLLSAHSVMMHGLIDEYGIFRSHSVGVVDGEGNIIHFGTLPDFIPSLVSELLNWAKNTDIHLLISSCVVHYELEQIHPFADGNGRMGRLWHTLMLSTWNPIFAWLPIESMIHDRQKEYYNAINISNNQGESTVFISFMLSTIKAVLKEAIRDSGKLVDESTTQQDRRWVTVRTYIKDYKKIQNSTVCVLLNVSSATANRLLRMWVEEGKLERIRDGKIYVYKLKRAKRKKIP